MNSLQTSDAEAAVHAVAPRVSLADIEARSPARYTPPAPRPSAHRHTSRSAS
jgi:hypothetical protein